MDLGESFLEGMRDLCLYFLQILAKIACFVVVVVTEKLLVMALAAARKKTLVKRTCFSR